MDANAKFNVQSTGVKFISIIIVEIARLLLMIYGIYLIKDGQIEVGALLIIYNYYQKIVDNYTIVSNILISKKSLKVSFSRFGKILENASKEKVDNKEIDLSDQFANLSPEEILNLDNMDKDTLIKELGLSEEQIKALGFADGEAFYNSFNNALDKYDSMPFFEKSKINAENAGILLGDLSKGNIDEVLKDMIEIKQFQKEYLLEIN